MRVMYDDYSCDRESLGAIVLHDYLISVGRLKQAISPPRIWTSLCLINDMIWRPHGWSKEEEEEERTRDGFSLRSTSYSI